jgi:hypothetical protein
VPEHASLTPTTHFAPLVPDEADEAAADLAASALVGDGDGAYDAQIRIESYDAEQEQSGERRSGLAPLAQDVANSAQTTARGYLSASDELLARRDDVDPAMRERLEREATADPLSRGNQRLREFYLTTFARAFNAVAEPIGQSIFTMALAPIRLGVSVARYAIERYREESMPLQRRQALAEWKDFLARYPDAPESPAVAKRVEDAEKRWQSLQRERAVEAAERAQDDGRPAEARALAQRALRIDPDDAKARKIEERASQELAAQQEAATRSVRFELPEGVPLVPEGARELTLALLAPGGDVAAAGAAVPKSSPVADEARFAQASAAAQAGRETEAQTLLQQVADGGGTMARHAQVELSDPIRNPWPHFQTARGRDRWHSALFVVVGPLRLPQATPDSVALWLLDVPQLASTVATLPLRAIELPWLPPPPTARATAVQARRYLDLHPRGVHAEEVRAWLEDYEGERGNHVAALRVAEGREPAPDLEPLRQEAAKQTLEVARKEERLDLRAGMLDGVVQRFPETKAAGEARDLLREEIEKATPQRIAVRRGFLLENPEVAGPRGFGIPPALLDGDPRNGELHPDGVALVGGRRVEIAFLAASGKDTDPPERRDVQMSEEQLARVVASLEETSFRNSLLDSDDAVEHDSKRDLAFERARLGLADQVDTRPEARAEYAYRGMRERYGVVRGREPWLPFDLVLQGSLADLSLGAFPRWREPKKTPDATLFQ